VEPWANFFLGELGASAAASGLLFVSLSVNQARILELGRIADRGLEALSLLLMILILSSLALIPSQTPRTFGAISLFVAGLQIGLLLKLERAQWSTLMREHRMNTLRVFALAHVSTWLVGLSAAGLLWRNDWLALYMLPAGILLAFITAGLNAWVLLIEINR
jgi:hypothetical protein